MSGIRERRLLVAAAGVLALALALTTGAGRAVGAASFTVVDQARAAGLYELNESWSARPVDVNNDGCQDVWIGYHDQGGKLWRGNCAGVYTRVAAGAWPRRNAEGKIPDRHECDWADVDHNGLKDAACAAGRGGDNQVKHGKDNELWRQTTLGTFAEAGTQWGIGDLCGRSHYLRFVEANGDGWVDLVVGNAPPRPVTGDPCDDPANGLPNEESKLFLNVGGQRFEQAPASFGIGGHWGVRCLEVVDWNRDGWQDLLACSDQGLKLFRNNAGAGFSNIAASVGLTATTFSDAELADLDGDGDLDLVAIRWDRLVYRLNTGGRLGAAVTIRSLQGGRALALGDADGNGSRDVYALLANVQMRTNPDDVLLLNAGLRFTPLAVPPAGGIGDAVVTLAGDGDGRAEFLVLNGQEDALGPVQLIELVPAN
jgi:hypothetical protein